MSSSCATVDTTPTKCNFTDLCSSNVTDTETLQLARIHFRKEHSSEAIGKAAADAAKTYPEAIEAMPRPLGLSKKLG